MTRSKGQKESRKHEDRLAKKVGGKRNAGSGAFWSRKGDVRSEDLLIEHKWTGKASVSVKAAVLEKIVKEAILDSRMPVLGFHPLFKLTSVFSSSYDRTKLKRVNLLVNKSNWYFCYFTNSNVYFSWSYSN